MFPAFCSHRYMNFIYVALGGAIGSVTRYSTSLIFQSFGLEKSWLATLTVNAIGSFLIALLIAIGERFIGDTTYFRPLLVIGFCGGFTTFSTFTLEAYQLYSSGAIGLALLYVALSLGLSIGGLLLGFGVAGKIS